MKKLMVSTSLNGNADSHLRFFTNLPEVLDHKFIKTAVRRAIRRHTLPEADEEYVLEDFDEWIENSPIEEFPKCYKSLSVRVPDSDVDITVAIEIIDH